ncbi:hypothetical protein [Alteribacillus bidgolensis]|nr:hypothetical protein [Alteribacillus bidgolensis]
MCGFRAVTAQGALPAAMLALHGETEAFWTLYSLYNLGRRDSILF